MGKWFRTVGTVISILGYGGMFVSGFTPAPLQIFVYSTAVVTIGLMIMKENAHD